MRVRVLLANEGSTPGALVLDDSEHKRSTVTTRIVKAHQRNDQASGGYLKGQRLVLWRLVTGTVTLPVGCAFDRPDPGLTAWRTTDQQRTQQGGPAQSRPPPPARHPLDPTHHASAWPLLDTFSWSHPSIAVTLVLADA
jgi:hypothetical protein